jgi:hypothetical protein
VKSRRAQGKRGDLKDLKDFWIIKSSPGDTLHFIRSKESNAMIHGPQEELALCPGRTDRWLEL